MKDAEPIVVPADPKAPRVPMPATNDSLEHADADPAIARRRSLARALQLGHLLQVHVIVDHTGWLCRHVDITYRRESGNTIRPIRVRVGRDVSNEDVLADGGALGICRKYNEALDELRQLAIRLAAVAREGHVAVSDGSPLAAALRELLGLDALVVSRQMTHMGNGVARLDRLRAEIAFLEERHACLVPIVITAEREAHPSWEEDTQELQRDD